MSNTFSAYWQRKCKSTPQLLVETNKLTLTVASLRSQLEKAYEAGSADKAAVAKEFEKISKGDDLFSFDSLFKQ